jgi:rhodanese-related sulfurtransferase
VKGEVDKGTGAMVIDSRPTKTKYIKGHIPTAISIPDSQWEALSGRLPTDKSIPLVFYCGGFKCKLSHKSAAKAMALGYTDVKVFAAGYPAWKAKYAGAETGTEITAGEMEGAIEIAQFKDIVANKPQSIMLVDVRDPDEFAAGHFKTSVNIPVDALEEKIATLPADKPIVFVCSTGARSGEAFYMSMDVRPELKNVYYLDAEVTFHKDGTYDIVKPGA